VLGGLFFITSLTLALTGGSRPATRSLLQEEARRAAPAEQPAGAPVTLPGAPPATLPGPAPAPQTPQTTPSDPAPAPGGGR
jgi:hypothetical protein